MGDDNGCTICELVNAFLRNKQAKLDAGELASSTFADYHRICSRLAGYFGRNCRVDDLLPGDFEKLRRQLAKDLSVVTLKCEINKFRIVLKFASDQRFIGQGHPQISQRSWSESLYGGGDDMDLQCQ